MQHQDDALISVVIASYNAASTLPAQLTALAGQVGAGPFEVVVADNGSTDDTHRVLDEWVDHLDLVPVRANGGRGPGYARNTGVRAARGEHILFCDADDVVDEDWVAAMRRGLRQHQFVAGRQRGELLNPRWVQQARPAEQRGGLQYFLRLTSLPHAGAGNMGVHRSVFESVGGFTLGDGALEDTDLCWRIQLTGIELHFVPDAVVHTRMRSSMRGIARQAFHYGRGLRRLERRHSGLPRTGAHLVGAGEAHRPRRKDPRAHLAAAAWRLGWFVGHHAPDPAPTVDHDRPVRP